MLILKKMAAILLLALLSAFCGCGEGRADANAEADYTFTDDLGRTVTITSCDRTAALLGSYADIWMLAGGTVCATADDAWDDLQLSLPEDTVNLGNTHKLSMEQLLGADPDFILASAIATQQLEWQASLDEAGIATAYFDVSDFDDYLNMLKICTDITGNEEAYDRFGISLKTQIEEILARNQGSPPQSVLTLRASAASIRAKNSDNTVLGGMLKDFGCRNIADDDSSLLENLSVESIALQNPDKIFIMQSGDDEEGMRQGVEAMFRENPLWGELDAVKNGQVYYMDKQLYSFKPNARWAEAYEKLEEYLYSK